MRHQQPCRAFGFSCCLAISSMLLAAQSPAEIMPVQRGRSILAKMCASCHAIGLEDASRHPKAPPFRALSARYPIEHLAEALAEGIVSGHPDMPEYVFPPTDVEAVIAYIKSLDAPRRR